MIKLGEVFTEWNENEITKYEKLISLTNKSTLVDKYNKKLKNHVSVRNNTSEIIRLMVGDTLEFKKELKRYGLIKRLK